MKLGVALVVWGGLYCFAAFITVPSIILAAAHGDFVVALVMLFLGLIFVPLFGILPLRYGIKRIGRAEKAKSITSKKCLSCGRTFEVLIGGNAIHCGECKEKLDKVREFRRQV